MTFSTALRGATALLGLVRLDAGTSDAELLSLTAEVERAGRVVDALRTAAAAEIARRSDRMLGRAGLAARQGHRTPSALVESLTLVSGRQADRRAKAGRQFEPLPGLAAAVAAGSVGMDAAESIAAALAPLGDVASGEIDALLGLAAARPADEVAAAAKAARDRIDAAGVDQRERNLRAQRYLRFGREVDGMIPVRGLLPPEDAGVVQALFDARTSVRRSVVFASEPSNGDGEHRTEAPSAPARPFDDRTMDQRRADTLVDVCRIAAGALGSDAGESALSNGAGTLVVTIDHQSLLAELGAAGIEGVTESISAASARRIACNAHILPIVLGGPSQPIDFGRSRRYFSSAQRRALALRDKGCATPGCDAPPGWSEAHHIAPWSLDGPTDLDNGILLCSFHHHQVHEGILIVERHPAGPEVRLAVQPRRLAGRPTSPPLLAGRPTSPPRGVHRSVPDSRERSAGRSGPIGAPHRGPVRRASDQIA